MSLDELSEMVDGLDASEERKDLLRNEIEEAKHRLR